jgi:sulfur-oxidizing protein SoxZ
MSALVNVPAKAKAGEVVEIKVLMRHPMETGFRTGRDGALVPRNIIREVRCLYDGREVLRAELHPAVTANPFFAFHLRAERSGEIALVWKDAEGEHRAVRRIEVT